MIPKFILCTSVLALSVVATPAKDSSMFEGQGDTATVESTVRETRAAPNHIGDLIQPGVKDAFLYTYGDKENDDGDLHGYSKKMDDKGQDGYKHFDSYQKRDGDKYGYEKHSEYGQENKANIDTENDEGLKLAHLEANDGKAEDGEESRSYAVSEQLDEDQKIQPKKKVESDYSYYGDGDSGGGSYYGSEESADEGDGGAESSEGDDGDGENQSYEESEESSEGGEEGEEEDAY